uniref:PML-orf1 n=1 Tax=Methanohalophilus mahii TaxID=2176 RepID=Q6QWE4_9EURY|nr:pML-orf1 [Methanohalophilus mahii]AAR99343.1 pML-orf1 [Methanohalophilus mahii]
MVSPLRNALNGVKANPSLRKYTYECQDFVDYMENTESVYLEVQGVTPEGKEVSKQMPYVHRFTNIYRRGILAKFYQLENYLKRNPQPITMITLTTYQDSQYSVKKIGHKVDHEQALEMLVDGFRKLRELITNRICEGHTPDYFWILEPHESGYPHMHLCYLEEFTEGEQEHIKSIWADKYGAGEQVDFSFRKPEDTVRSIRNYLMKYMSKGFLDSGSKYSSTKMKPAQLVFNALLKKSKARMWGCSRHLSKVMARPGQQSPMEIVWYRVVCRNRLALRPDVSKDIGSSTFWFSRGKAMLAEFKSMLALKQRHIHTVAWKLQDKPSGVG